MADVIYVQKIPIELRQRCQWVLWRTEGRNGDRPTKVPYNRNGVKAKANDPATWGSFEEVYERFKRGGFDGIGFEFSETDEFCGIDLDGCRNPETKQVDEWAREMIATFDTYAEVSPSQTGVKLFVRGEWKGDWHKKTMPGDGVGGKKPGIEIYDRLRYFAITGQRLSGSYVPELRQQELEDIIQRFKSPDGPQKSYYSTSSVVERARKYIAKLPPSIEGQRGHDAAFRAACVLVLGFGLDDGDSFGLLNEWNASCQPPWSEHELRHKIESAAKQTGERNYLRNVQPSRFDSVQVPNYAPTKPKSTVRVTTLREATDNFVKSLRLPKPPTFEIGIPELDKALVGGVQQGEFTIFAGRPSHGKSAIALQMVHHWTSNGIPCLFISEEMSADSLGKRTLQFATDIPVDEWRSLPNIGEEADKHFEGREDCIIIESSRTAETACEEIRRAVNDSGVRAVVVDYAQLLKSAGNSRYEQVTNTSVCLRQVTNETKVALVALCQLSREIESRDTFVPRMSDLKESGQLEQDADVIVFCVWPHRIDHKRPPHDYKFYIAKNRNRGIEKPVIDCRFEPMRQMFMKTKIQDHPNYRDEFAEFGFDE